jgi:hypothetical protein
MTAYLFLQKFEAGKPVNLPYKEVVNALAKYGKAGIGSGDTEIHFPENKFAQVCTIAGSEAEGVNCIGFERPLFDDDLRLLVWECMVRFRCTVFDGTLHTLCTPPHGIPALPEGMTQAAVFDARQICTMQQLWPKGTEMAAHSGQTFPALAYTNRNPDGANLQLFDSMYGDNPVTVTLNFEIIEQACNPGTLRVLRNTGARINAAGNDNPKIGIVLHFDHPGTDLAYMESPAIGESAKDRKITISVSGDALFGGWEPASPFVADQWAFENALGEASELTRVAEEKHQLTVDASPESVSRVSAFLDQMHVKEKEFRQTKYPGQQVNVSSTTNWARMVGGFLATLIRLQVGGQCGYIQRGAYRLPVVRTYRGRIINPYLLALDHIINGPRNSIGDYYQQLRRDGTFPIPPGEDQVCGIPIFIMQLQGRHRFADQGLPLAEHVPHDKLDLSVHSLRFLDEYLIKVAKQVGTLPKDLIGNVMLTVGAYVGEVICRSATPKNYWRWVPYDVHASANPEFAQQRPRTFIFMSVLDSRGNTTYPMAQVGLILHEHDTNPPPTPVFDYARQIINLTRGPLSCRILDELNISQLLRQASAQEREYLNIPLPPWKFPKGYPLLTWFENTSILLNRGRLVWSHVVQANNMLFTEGPHSAPGDIVYDPQGILTPDELAPVAKSLFALREQEQQPNPDAPGGAELCAIAKHLNSETTVEFGLPVPRHLSAEPLLFSTIFFERKHLPGGKLTHSYFPVLIHDQLPGFAVVLPARFWPPALMERVSKNG